MNALATDHRNAEVAALVAAGDRRADLSRRFGVSVVRIGEIVRREAALRPGAAEANAALLDPCARPSCGQRFLARAGTRRRMYCTDRCRHAVAIAAWTRRKRAAARPRDGSILRLGRDELQWADR